MTVIYKFAGGNGQRSWIARTLARARNKFQIGKEPDYVAAHKHSSQNKAELLASEVCGCFFCERIFAPSEIDMWRSDCLSDEEISPLDDVEDTAFCPYCAIDSVIGSKSGYPINPEFLAQMKAIWF